MVRKVIFAVKFHQNVGESDFVDDGSGVISVYW